MPLSAADQLAPLLVLLYGPVTVAAYRRRWSAGSTVTPNALTGSPLLAATQAEPPSVLL